MTSLIENQTYSLGFIPANLFLNFTEVPLITYTGVKKDNSRKNANFKGVIFLKETENRRINEITSPPINKKPINENWHPQIKMIPRYIKKPDYEV